MTPQLISLFSLIFFSTLLPAQEERIYNLRNCQGEMRTVTFQQQVNVILRCVSGNATIRKQKVLNFSPENKLDTVRFEAAIEKIKKTLPLHFFKIPGYSGNWFDNIPDEKSIWFTEVFAQKSKDGNYKVYSAIKIYFTGTDAKDDEQRTDPKITGIDFIFDKVRLDKLAQKLKVSPAAGQKN